MLGKPRICCLTWHASSQSNQWPPSASTFPPVSQPWPGSPPDVALDPKTAMASKCIFRKRGLAMEPPLFMHSVK